MSRNKSKLSDRGLFFNVAFYGQFDEVERALLKAQHYAYIFHNQDEEDEHYHLLIRYTYQRTVSAVLKDFVSYSNCFVELLNSPIGSLDYLTHSNNPEKYQYSEDRIVFDEFDYWHRVVVTASDKKQDEMNDFIDDLVKYAHKSVSSREMAIKYGRDFIKNRISYEDFGLLISREER